MASLYWIEESLPGLLPCLWMFAAVGLPWAFAVIARMEWRSYALVGALALALGPAWVTAWMLILGIIGAQLDLRLLTSAPIIAGSAFIGLAGAIIAWRKRTEPIRPSRARRTLAFDERLIIALIVIAVLLRWLHTVYFPFTAYDALWVYGYQGRLYFHEGLIPNSIGYYPPFLSLQFAYVQALIGAVNDHAARMVLPLMHIGSILAAYLLGQRLVSRRVGLIVAALWSLHPYVGQWSYRGDLEIPLTFSFTLAAVFFLGAWRERDNDADRRHLSILAGVMLGIALFTKPTAGAFIWAVILLLALELLRTRLDAQRWLPRFRAALWTGLACLPLGAIWYIRNLLLGHDAITLPKAVWLTRALRSGDYLAPLLVAVAAAWLALALRHTLSRRELTLGAAGLALLLASALASNATLFPARVDPPASYVQPAEALMMLAGLALAGYSVRRVMVDIEGETARLLRLSVWALLLSLPYFLTFFFSYSYHYRLGFAILPLLCLPIAIALSRIIDHERLRTWSAGRRRLYAILLTLLCLPGVLAVATDVSWSSIWLLRDDLNSDFKKYEFYNPSLMQVVAGLEDYIRESATEAIVLAPGEERLPFFFPRLPIHDSLLTRLDELEPLDATHVVYGAKAREAYLDAGIDPQQTQLVAALGRYYLFEKVRSHYHGVFSYELYRVGNIRRRWQMPAQFAARKDEIEKIIFDGRLRLYPESLHPQAIHEKMPITFEPTWQALQPISQDYEFVLQVRYPSGEVGHEWRFFAAPHRHGAYHTSLWAVGEFINDRQIFRLDEDANLNAKGFTFWLGVWDREQTTYLPLTVDDAAAGEFHRLPGTYHLWS